MTARIANPFKHAAAQMTPLVALEKSFEATSLEPLLRHLVKLRASQINGCAFCINMHVGEALADGEDAMRLHLLAGWHEAEIYSPRERAALTWTEALTRLAETRAPDEDYAMIAQAFTEQEQVQLTLLIGAINLWNRLQVGFRAAPGPGVRNAA
jgi:AhpD family alkylhydroperoxidase